MTKKKKQTEHAGKELKFEYKNVDDLIPYAKNTKIHHPEQIMQIAASIKEFGFISPIVIDKDRVIAAGHGRLLGAKKLGMKTVPTIQVEHLTDTQRRAYTIADNRIAESNSEWDKELLQIELHELANEDFDFEDFMTFDDLDLPNLENDFMDDSDSGEDSSDNEEIEKYTRKIEIPVYEPKEDDQPSLSELYDEEKTNTLKNKIKDSNASNEIKEFLLAAAQRHTKFRYDRIAEYYCHASKEIQELMEESALVIIDFDKAIENGFVKLVGEMKEAYSEEHKAKKDKE